MAGELINEGIKISTGYDNNGILLIFVGIIFKER